MAGAGPIQAAVARVGDAGAFAPARPDLTWAHTLQGILDTPAEFARQAPHLVKVRQIGASGSGRYPLTVMSIASEAARDGAAPLHAHIGGVHAREIGIPPMLHNSVAELLDGYGSDPAITRRLDSSRMEILTLANPDGYLHVQEGTRAGSIREINWRGNEHRVDLNRNHAARWGEDMADVSPGTETYPGPSAASEAETQAINGWLASISPVSVVDWHSAGDVVLVPPPHAGWSDASRGAHEALGRELGEALGFRVTAQTDFAPAGGTLSEWVSTQLGSRGYTVEVGTERIPLPEEFERWLQNGRAGLGVIADAASSRLA